MSIVQDRRSDRAFFDLLPDAVIIVDGRGRIADINSRASVMFGYDEAELRGRPVELLMPQRFRAHHVAQRAGYAAAPRPRAMGSSLDLYGRRKDGSEVPVDIMLSPMSADGDGSTIAVIRDVSERRRLQEEERQAREMLAAVIDASPVAIFCLARDKRVLVWSRAAETLFGYGSEEIVGQVYDLVPPEGTEEFERLFARALAGETLRNIQVRRRRKDSSLVDISFAAAPLHNADGTIRGVAYAFEDMTERLKARARLRHLAYRDQLTGLPNRASLQADLEARLQPDGTAAPRPLALAMLDIDGFKDVNDTLGHSSGDALLRATARRLGEAAGERASLYRTGADEFAVLMPDCGDPRPVAALLDTMLERIDQPFEIDGQEVHVGASAGITLAPADADHAGELVANASLALFAAKSEGGRKYRLYHPTLRAAAQARRELNGELRRAFAGGEFELFFQPQIRLSDGALAGAEALLRWRHPERGLISPGAFIDTLATSPIAVGVGRWILSEACRHAAAWRAGGLPPARIGVNLFAAQLDGGRLAEEVADTLAETGLPPDGLELEITENIALSENATVERSLRALRAHGVSLAFDDFGTGYASLSCLTRYPLSRIKIDQSFVRNLARNADSPAIVRSLIAMARHLRLEITAEGIENEEQRAFLAAAGCQEGQGYLFARPMPADEFEAFLRAAGRPHLAGTRLSI